MLTVHSGLSRKIALLWNALETPVLELSSIIPFSRCLLVIFLSLAHAPSKETTSQFASGRSSCRLAMFLIVMFSFVT